MSLQKEVERCNDLFRRELGNFAWMWSEDLYYTAQKRDESGIPVYDYVCACGVNKRIHDPQCKSLVVPRPVYVRKHFPGMDHQWVLVRRLPSPLTEHQFRQAFGSQLPYERFIWVPCPPVYLDPNEVPTQEITEVAIRTIKQSLEKSANEMAQEQDERIAKRDSKRKEDIRDDIKDSFPAFYGTPGQKTHWSAGGIKDTPLAEKQGASN